MTYGIMVKDKSIVDPFDSNYEGINQALEQAHQKAVETAYNIKINYVEYDEEVASGHKQAHYLVEGVFNQTLKEKNIFAVSTSSNYLKPLIKTCALVPLYDFNLETGYFVDCDYVQNSWIDAIVSKGGKVYAYHPSNIYPDSYLCYNATKVKELGLEDPSEMWFKGEWTWDNFDSWVKSSSEYLNSGEFVVDVRYADFLIGASSAQGIVLANQQRSVAQLSKSVPCTIVNNMKTYNEMGYLNNNRGLDDISNLFIQGDSLLHNGSTSILKALNNNSDVNFEVGIVPYPLKNDSIVTVYTEAYTYVDSLGNTVSINSPLKNRDGEVIKTSDGKDVYGIDLSQTRFYTSLTTIDCYGLINYPGDGIDGLDTSIAFSILHDLKSKNILIKETTTINDSQSDSINKEVINSISSKLYYDQINRISFNTAYYKGSQYSLPIVINDLVLSDKDTFEVLDEINHMYNELNYPIVW